VSLANLLKTVESFCFTLVNIEHCQEFGDRKQILELLRQVEELKLARFLVDSGITGNEFANPTRIDVTNTR
jgi:hypothetical protein